MRPFLLPTGNSAAYRDRAATAEVASLAPVLTALKAAGGEFVGGPATAPNGARHPDDTVFEYTETSGTG